MDRAPTKLDCLLLLLVLPVQIILRGWALSILWHWFIAPMTHVEIGIFAALGIAVIKEMMWFKSARLDKQMKTRAEVWFSISQTFANYAGAVGVGYLLHLGM